MTELRSDVATGLAGAFAPWIKHYPGSGDTGAVVVFPHAGGAAVAYRDLATTLSGKGIDTYVVQYPRRADRLEKLSDQLTTVCEIMTADLSKKSECLRLVKALDALDEVDEL